MHRTDPVRRVGLRTGRAEKGLAADDFKGYV